MKNKIYTIKNLVYFRIHSKLQTKQKVLVPGKMEQTYSMETVSPSDPITKNPV